MLCRLRLSLLHERRDLLLGGSGSCGVARDDAVHYGSHLQQRRSVRRVIALHAEVDLCVESVLHGGIFLCRGLILAAGDKPKHEIADGGDEQPETQHHAHFCGAHRAEPPECEQRGEDERHGDVDVRPHGVGTFDFLVEDG